MVGVDDTADGRQRHRCVRVLARVPAWAITIPALPCVVSCADDFDLGLVGFAGIYTVTKKARPSFLGPGLFFADICWDTQAAAMRLFNTALILL